MKPEDVLSQLKSLGNEKQREMAIKRGGSQNQFGVKMGDLRILAKKIKTDHKLALELWQTGNEDAMLLSILIMKPEQVPAKDLEKMVEAAKSTQLADWLNSYVVKSHPEKEKLRLQWLESSDPMVARAGWSLTAERISKDPEGLDLKAMLDRIEKEMAAAPEAAQWTMNYCLAGIGINFPEYRERAMSIGERLGIFRDYPTPKGCTSPFAPLWIAEMVKRQG